MSRRKLVRAVENPWVQGVVVIAGTVVSHFLIPT